MSAVALTGGVASGKSAAAGFIQKAGIPVLDTDHVAAELTRTGGRALPALVEAFGEGCLDGAGALDRAAMRQRVFADARERLRLEAILHPMIRETVGDFLARQDGSPCVVLIPLLFESLSYRAGFDETVCVDCPVRLQIRRMVELRGLDEDLARRIVASQVPRAIRLQLADHVLCNTGDLGALERQVRDWLDRPGKTSAAQNVK